MNLKEARKQGKLKEFIKEREKDEKQESGDKAKLDKALKEIAQNHKPKSSKQS